jgi:hypothetical protein
MDLLRIECSDKGFVVLVETRSRDDSTQTQTIHEAAAIISPLMRPEWSNAMGNC